MNSERASKQQAFWDAVYSEDPHFFGSQESQFSHWALPFLREYGVSEVLEMGFGYGRDTDFLNGKGMKVTAVDISSVGFDEARRLLAGREGVDLFKGNSLHFLNDCKNDRFDAVYSNLFLNMHFSLDEHTAIYKEIARVLKPGGIHLFSVRSKSDPWYGRGVRVAPDTFDHSPAGTTLVYFSEQRLNAITPKQLLPLKLVEVEEGKTDFPIVVLYVAQVKGA